MDLALSVVGGCGRPDLCVISWFKYQKRTLPTNVIFLQQAGHVTHRPAIASKNSSQGLSQQLSKSSQDVHLRKLAVSWIQHKR